MKPKQNPFRVRPIRKSWNEKFWKKGTWRTHHTALFAMVLVLGVAFGFDAAFGANVSDPTVDVGFPSLSPPPSPIDSPAPIDAAAPNSPTGAPTGASVVTPKFSGANIQGYVFNQVAAEDAITNPLQLYDTVNVWGGLNVIDRVVNSGFAVGGGGVPPVGPTYLGSDPEFEPYDPGLRIDDVLDVDHGIVNTSVAHNGFVNIIDAVEIQPLTDAPAPGIDGSNNKMLVLNNNFGEADIELTSGNASDYTWEVGAGNNAIGATTFYIKNTEISGPTISIPLTIDLARGITTVNQNMTVNGLVTAPIINASIGGAIGRYYSTTTSTVSSVATKSATALCTGGDTVIACGGFHIGVGANVYGYRGSVPVAGGCNAQSMVIPPNIANGSTLTAYAFCFSPDG